MATYDDVVNLAVRRSLFFPSNEIYPNAPAGFYDYGPYGATIKRKVIEMWRKDFVQKTGCLEIDGAITVTEDVLRASGHLANFSDPMTQCSKCHKLNRADELLREKTKKEYKEAKEKEKKNSRLLRHY